MDKIYNKFNDENQVNSIKIKTGKYRHYKGNLYEVIGIAKHSETLEDLVIYKPQYESISEYWVRPISMWNELVTVDGEQVIRFKRV